MRRWVLVGWLGVAGLSSCTIYALSDEVHQASCTVEIGLRDTCDALNDVHADDFDACTTWQCGPQHMCEFKTTDVDRDGFPPRDCVSAAERGDCDDHYPDSAPGKPEICDGRDNDCDQNVDEGMLEIRERVETEFSDDVHELAYGWNEMTHDVGFMYRAGPDDAVGFGIITSSGTATGSVRLSQTTTTLRAAAVDVVARAGGFVAGFVEPPPTQRIWVGSLRQAGTRWQLSVDSEDLRSHGLRCADDEQCAQAQTEGAVDQPQIPTSTRPALAALSGQVLAGYARKTEPAADGCSGSSAASSLLLNVLDDTSFGLVERRTAALQLDQTADEHAPSLASIETGRVPLAREAFGWLAGYSNRDHDIVVRRVAPQPDAELPDLRVAFEHEAAPYQEVQIVRGPIQDNRMLIGVVARAGCDESSRIVFGLVQLTWDATGRNELRVYRALREVGEPGQEASHPVLAYNQSIASWGVAYATPDGLFARVLDSNGLPVGVSAYRLSDAPPTIPDVAVIAGTRDNTEEGLFTVYSYSERANQSPSRALIAREVRTCRERLVRR